MDSDSSRHEERGRKKDKKDKKDRKDDDTPLCPSKYAIETRGKCLER